MKLDNVVNLTEKALNKVHENVPLDVFPIRLSQNDAVQFNLLFVFYVTILSLFAWILFLATALISIP